MRQMDSGRRVTLEALASLLMPAEPGRHGVLVETDERWRLERSALPRGTDVFLWGAAAISPARPSAVLLSAVRREAQLLKLRRHAPTPFRIRGIHRLPPPRLRGSSVRSELRAALQQGVLVEMTARTGELRVVDAAANAAGAKETVAGLRLGSGGTALALIEDSGGDSVLLRAGGSMGALPVVHAAAALEHLAASEVGPVPHLMASGEICGASWSTESLLKGHRPKQLTPRVIAEAIAFCLRLPRRHEATSVGTAIDIIAEQVPQDASALAGIKAYLHEACASLPGVMTHGDMWAGNLLVDRGGLSGVVDWDAWHPAGIPGTDVMYLMVAELWLRKKRPLGQIWIERPWRSIHFKSVTAEYWAGFELEPGTDLLDAVGIASWAAQVSGNLMRSPQLADNTRWVGNNVRIPLGSFGKPDR
ncbi:MAG: phosphotransferase [Actinobacteria bacterium]|nr:phosphotransferase [Actinomycetota bacterium]